MVRYFALRLRPRSLHRQHTHNSKVGLTLSLTGPAASLGIPEKHG